MKKNAVVLRHIEFEDLDAMEPLLCKAGFDITDIDVTTQTDWQVQALDADLLIVLGGPMGVYEQQRYPFIKQEILCVQHRLVQDRPVLGICLGSQIMAAALGANVYAGTHKEIGWAPVMVKSDHQALSGLNNQIPVLHWHGDTFDLPIGAVLLASSDSYPHQAFAFGKYGLALQFHIEVSAAGLERWYIGHSTELAAENISVALLKQQSQQYADRANQALASMLQHFLNAIP